MIPDGYSRAPTCMTCAHCISQGYDGPQYYCCHELGSREEGEQLFSAWRADYSDASYDKLYIWESKHLVDCDGCCGEYKLKKEEV